MTYCPYIEQVSAWLDDELQPEEAGQLAEHINTCLVCQEERASLERLSKLFTTLREVSPSIPVPFEGGEKGPDEVQQVISYYTIRRVLSIAAMVLMGIGALISLAPDLSQDELVFERYLDRTLDQDVFEVTRLVEDDLSRDRVVGLLISSNY